MSIQTWWENFKLRGWQLTQIEGSLCFDPGVLDIFLNAPYDILPDFQGPLGSKLKGGRGKDHPRYGRFTYAFAKFYKPALIVEAGTYAGGTSIGWAKALVENGQGRLICVDSDVYSKDTFPKITRQNLKRVGISDEKVALRAGKSQDLIPQIAKDHSKEADIYLVDGDHTYEGALQDIRNGLPMMKNGGFILVHDVDRNRRMDEQTSEHPHPVHEAFMKVVQDTRHPWCILKFIRKHLGIIRIA